MEIFDTLGEAKVLVERWRREYNQRRPHSALAYRPPAARGQITQVAGTGSYPLEWTSNGPRSNLEGGATRGGRSPPALIASVLSKTAREENAVQRAAALDK